MVVFLVFGNVALAEEIMSEDNSGTGSYYSEGQVVVYPAEPNAKEKEMMERFMRGGISEEEMQKLAKAQLGEQFSEMEFQKGMIELNERMRRKEAFSYEHEGYGQKYYTRPSYEGYSKEHMVFGMIFEHIGDDMDPREIKQYCREPEKIADIVIGKLKEKLGDLQKMCARFEEEESKCNEYSKKVCSQIGAALVRNDASEIEKLTSVAYSCPVNKDAIVEACKRRSLHYMEQRIKNADEECKKRFDFEGDKLIRECNRFRESNICDKERFIKGCMGGIKKEDFEEDKRQETLFMHATWQCYDGSTEKHTDNLCKSSEEWNKLAKIYCESRCSSDTDKCGVNSFSVSDVCRDSGTKPAPCPEYPVPKCGAGAELKTKTDSNGCTYYYCESISCPADVQQCPDGSYVKRIAPNCNFEACRPVTALKEEVKCVFEGSTTKQECSSEKGSCSGEGACISTVQGNRGEQITWKSSCGGYAYTVIDGTSKYAYFKCTAPTCPTVQKPSCAIDETLQPYYDNAGCVTSYQCLKQQTACPEVSKPACLEGQSLTTKYDDKGCITGYECINTAPTANAIRITGNVAASTYEDLLSKCENSWLRQQRICSTIQNQCDKETFMEKCREQERKNYEDSKLRIEQNCEKQTIAEIRHADQRCARIDKDRQRCLDENAKRCEHMEGVAQQCRELLIEENLKKFIVGEAKKRCKFTNIIQDEQDIKRADKAEIVLAVLNTATEEDIGKLELFVDDLKEELKLQDTIVYKGRIDPNRFGDIKLLPFVINAKLNAVASSERAKEVKANIVARQRTEDVAGKLASLRDSDVPKEYLYIIEDKASEVIDVSDKLEEIEKKEEQKGLGYKIRLFLGMAKKAEEAEIKQLEEGKSKLKGSVEALTKLIDEVPSDVAKAILKEQVESLGRQQEEIEVLIETKEKKSKGLLGIFG